MAYTFIVIYAIYNGQDPRIMTMKIKLKFTNIYKQTNSYLQQNMPVEQVLVNNKLSINKILMHCKYLQSRYDQEKRIIK